jgi:hypothetical protein
MEYLAEWFERFLKNRDLMLRKLSGVKREGANVLAEQKDGVVVHYHVVPFVDDFSKLIPELKEDNKGLVIYNTKDNFKGMIKAWNELSKLKNFTIYLVNPFSKLDKKWAINPRTHSLISDNESLELGLNSIFETVDQTTKEEIEKLTK